MLFPFDKIRPVQEEFMKDAKYAIENSMNMMAHAPTGLGKTAAAIAPALETALENGKAVLFLTARHSQHQIALETLRKIKKKSGKSFKVTDMIGKKWLCSVDDIEDLRTGEFNEFCKSMREDERCTFFNNTRTKEHILTKPARDVLTEMKNDFYHAEEAKEKLSGQFCTYEILSDLAKQSNVIIADYYHLFSPVRSSFLARIGRNLDDLIVIVDEAHNLPNRIRSIASTKLNSFVLDKAIKEARIFGYFEEEDDLIEIEKVVAQLAKEKIKDGKESFLGKKLFIDLIENRIGKIDEFLGKLYDISEEIKKDRKKSFISSVLKFFDMWMESETGYARIISETKSKSGKKYINISNNCLDPSVHSNILNECFASILMSGTLLPLEMNMELLGLDKNNTMLKKYVSPFPHDNRLNVIVKDTTTKYSKRTDANFEKMADYVVKCCNTIPGNCSVFFPSYYLRDLIYEKAKNNINKTILLEKQGANKAEKKKLYDNFVQRYKEGSALFGVISGSFDEGVDLPGDFLNGVVVVGIPLERPDLTTKALIDYYDLKFNRGWDYGYIYPAMTRCMQAAGRVIRSEEDRGVIVFIDERFVWSNYRKAFPSDMNIKITIKPEELIKNFWGLK